MENRIVKVKNLTNGRVGIKSNDLRFSRTWEKKGAVKAIPFETLQQLLYEDGVEYMFKQGILGIDELRDKIDLGLEEEGEEPRIIVLTDAQKKRYLTLAPVQELRELLKKLPREQIFQLVDYAIEHEISDLNRCDLLKKYTDIDIISAIKLNRDSKED